MSEKKKNLDETKPVAEEVTESSVAQKKPEEDKDKKSTKSKKDLDINIESEPLTEKNKAGEDSEKKVEDESLEKTEVVTAIQTNSIEKETVEEIGISEDIINEKMKIALEMKNPKKRKKSTILNVVLLIINLVLMFFIVKNLFASIDGESIVQVFQSQGKKMWWLAGGLLTYVFYIFIQVVLYRVLIKNLSGRKSWKTAYNAAIVGKYYDNITPFAAGGQTMQILTLTDSGIGAGVSTSIPILKMMINSGVNALLALIFFVFGLPFIPKTSILKDFLVLLLEIVGVIGLIITVLITIFIFLISSGKIVTRSLISWLLRVGYKLRLIKDYRGTYKKVMNQVAEYKFSMGYLWRHKKILLELIFFSILECLSYTSIVFFVVMAFTEQLEVNIFMFLFMCIAKYYLCQMASCYIPLPGGTGLMEISFILLFGMGLGTNGSYAAWGLLIFRFLTYYIIIIHGFIHELRMIITGIIRGKRSKPIKTLETKETK